MASAPLPDTAGIFANVRLPHLRTLRLGRFKVDWAELAALGQGSDGCVLQELHFSECEGGVTSDMNSWIGRAHQTFGHHVHCGSDVCLYTMNFS
jgi:hypothetical protein